MPVIASRSVATMSNTRRRVTAAASGSVSNSMHTSGRAVCISGTCTVSPQISSCSLPELMRNDVSWRVAVARDGGDAGKHLALLKQPRAVFVRRDLLPRAHEIKPPLALGRLGHGVVVEPMRRLVL